MYPFGINNELIRPKISSNVTTLNASFIALDFLLLTIDPLVPETSNLNQIFQTTP